MSILFSRAVTVSIWVFLAAFSAPGLNAHPAPPADSGFPFHYESARARGIGGAFSPVGDDATAIFVNPAALVLYENAAFIGEYHISGVEGGYDAWGLASAARAFGMVLGAGAAGASVPGGTRTSRFTASVSRNLVTGSAGSFLSVGISGTAGRLSLPADTGEGCVPCGSGRRSKASATMDAGMMIRPLPFISISFSILNAAGSDLGPDAEFEWKRETRYGIAWIHENRIIVAWEDRRSEGVDNGHFGVSVRTAVPVEVMAGMTGEKVSGGMRWDGGAWRASISFSQEEEGVIMTSLAFEIAPGREGRDYR